MHAVLGLTQTTFSEMSLLEIVRDRLLACSESHCPAQNLSAAPSPRASFVGLGPVQSHRGARLEGAPTWPQALLSQSGKFAFELRAHDFI